ncbi:sulfatase-like hydrolase/transferase [Microbacterium sp. R86528]|uniref:sulfatase-like hydrolase/transferase n=1 Tax=Microbacterium sp. R86528 TaxID=3093864 RepID=UPI0037C9554A
MAEAPNVVLIFMDDMTHWSLRSGQVSTPNLDALRARGITFTHAENQGSTIPAVCTPARRMLLTGMTVFDSEPAFDDVTRLGRALTGAGYASYFTGKWHNPESALGEDYAEVGPWGGGMLGTTDTSDEAYHRPGDSDSWDPADVGRGGHWMTRDDGQIQHSSERWTDAAVGFVARDHGSAPFFLHIAYHAPHDPRQAPREFLDQYPADQIRIPLNYLPEHPFDNGSLRLRDEKLAPFPRTEAAVQLHRREYFAMITHVDREIGRLLGAIDEAEARSDRETVIVFSGDHGLALGEHGLLGKQSLYDHSTRVPLVIVGPGVPSAQERTTPVYSGSIYATICDLVGVTAPEHLQFPSLVPMIDGRDASGDVEVFTAYGMDQRAVRRGRFKLISYADVVHDQLFDTVADPWERHNLIADSANADLVESMRGQLRRAQIALHDPAVASDHTRAVT